MKVSDVTNVQSAVNFVGYYVGSRNEDNRLTAPILKSLFDEHIPSYPHIFSALTRGSGRPPAGAWTKQRAIKYFQILEAKLMESGIEEWILFAVLWCYQKPSEPVIEASMAKAVSRLMIDRNCSAPAAAQHLECAWIPDADGKGVKANYLLVQYQRYWAKRDKT